MALATVGGAFLSSFVNVLLDRMTSPEVVNWIRGKKVDPNLLQRLETPLCVVRAVLNDAEQKQITDRAVKNWLTNLEDAVYVADDLLNEVSTKAATQKGSGNFLSQSESELVTKMEGIIDRLESAVKLKDALHLTELAEDKMPWRPPSTSLVDKSHIYGRDKDKEAIIDLLLDDTYDGEIPVISIVGIGGIGKTTLAQLVYNDDKVKGKFNSRAWVCVAEKFDVINVTKAIMDKFKISYSPCNTNDFDSLQTNLKKELTGKTFLIVLDDVWNDRLDLWEDLLKPFKYGNEASKILVTTRNEKVVSVNPTIPSYKLSILSDEDCWSVFLRYSYLSIKSRDYATLEQIGRKIAEKCRGLPLAVKTLGGLLRTKDDVKDWNDILKSEIWELSENDSRIIPALRISYHDLPSHLKCCFVYCSLFSQDHKFYKDELILQWMAEGFLLPMGDKPLEEIGCIYFDELVARSFFQPDKIIDRFFVMHDLIHDLATFCAGEFYFRVKKLGNAIEIGCKTRHLSYNGKRNFSISKLLTTCHDAKHMRTFVDMSWNIDPFFTENALCMLLSQFRFLRVLSFRSFPLDSLPDSIDELIHLRYLDFSYTNVVTLPESMSNMYNLQTLKLRGCEKLEMLPSGMQELVNFHHLDISGTRLKEMPKGMSKLKKHLHFLSDYIVGEREENRIRELGPLANLHGTLSISNLENVTDGDEALEARMIDKPHIDRLLLRWSPNSNVADSQVERGILDKLRPHSNLKELSIDGYRGTIFSDWLGHSSYKNMTNLTLRGCGNCWKLPSLGQLSSLKHLKISHFDKLHSIDADFYKNDGESCWETPFQSLETLGFDRLDCWEKWCSFEFDDAFPKLKELTIAECPALIGDLPNHLPDLEKLYIGEGCEQLACFLPRAPAMLELTQESKNKLRMQEFPLSLPDLSIQGDTQVESVLEAMTRTQPTCLHHLYILDSDSALSFPGDCLPASLQSLGICDCKKLDFPMQQQQQHESLRSLEISFSCDSLTSFPLNAFPNLADLEVEGCENMKSLVVSQSYDAACSSLRSLKIKGCPKFMSFSTLWMAAPQLESLCIRDCPEIDSLPGDCLPASLQSLTIYDCKKLDFPMQQQQHESLRSLKISSSSLTSFPLNAFPNLTHLRVKGCENMKSLVVSQSHDAASSSLRSLKIKGCPKFMSFSTLWMAAPQLESLNIQGCPEIDSFPGGGLPPNLRQLVIGGCEKLVSCLASMDLRSHGLTCLHIFNASESVKSFPNEGCLPASLDRLSLLSSPGLETLDCNGLSHLTSLQSLSISRCDNLKNIMGERLPASLKRLDILYCPLLGARQLKDPQIWPKISHIPYIGVDSY